MTKKTDFSNERLGEQVIAQNILLNEFLESRKDIQIALLKYFAQCILNDCEDGIKKFNLESWGGCDYPSSLEIVLIDAEFKFARCFCGMLYSINYHHLKSENKMKKVMDNFFLDPQMYILKNTSKN
jgi:hypothetical protein